MSRWKIYDWLKNLKTPKWLFEITEYLSTYILYPALKELGEEGKNFLEILIVDAAKQNISNEEKFKYVFDAFIDRWDGKTMKTATINIGIELLVAMLKKKGFID